MDTRIKNVKAWQILDSRGNPTLTVEVETKGGTKGRASVPSGASTGIYEACELRDENNDVYNGKGVLKAVDNVNNLIAEKLTDICTKKQQLIDEIMIELDGTDNKSKLGANAILGVSLACAKTASNCLSVPLYKYIGGTNAKTLPVPMVNILNGGAHADNLLDFQEFMITPVGASNFEDAIRISAEVFHSLKKILKKKGMVTAVGDEGGFAPNLSSNREALDLIVEAITVANYSTDSVKICLDVASSEFYKDNKYEVKGENVNYDREGMAQYLKDLVEDYPIISIEDAMAQNDYEGWRIITDLIGDKCLLVGDDLFTTNSKLLQEGIDSKIANAILIKPNQIGTLTETLDTINLAQRSGYKTIISHRSGETEDTFIADLAVGVNSGLIKTGSMSRSERIAKYNRLSEISGMLQNGGKYLGMKAYFSDYTECACSCNL